MVESSDHAGRKRLGGLSDPCDTAQESRRRPGGHRRRWSDADKARIVAESRAGTASIADVARRHHVHPNQLYAWRHAFQDREVPCVLTDQTGGDRPVDADFIPVTVASSPAIDSREAVAQVSGAGDVIEILVGPLTVRLGGGTPLPVLERVLQAAWRLT